VHEVSETPKVYAAISACVAALAKDGISKGRKNQHQGYAFRGIDDIFNALASVLAANSLCIIPRVLTREVIERQTSGGKPLFYVNVDVEFDLVCAIDGSKHTARVCGEAMDSADKATNKAMSAAYKYMALQLFCIPTEGDNDADATTHVVAAATPTAPHSRELSLLVDAIQACDDIDALRALYEQAKSLSPQECSVAQSVARNRKSKLEKEQSK
jgi:hypothetical protein